MSSQAGTSKVSNVFTSGFTHLTSLLKQTDSWTGRTLKNTGVLAVWHESLARVTLHSNRAIEWTQTNVPKYYTNLCRSIGPHVKVARGFLTTWISVIWDSLMPVRQWFNKTVPPLFDHVSFPYLNRGLFSQSR